MKLVSPKSGPGLALLWAPEPELTVNKADEALAPSGACFLEGGRQHRLVEREEPAVLDWGSLKEQTPPGKLLR